MRVATAALAVVVCLSASVIAQAADAAHARTVTLAQALAAVGQAPEHRAAAARAAAAGRAVRSAGGAPPTTVTFGTTRIQGKLNTEVLFPLPVFGRLGAERGVARADRAVAQAAEGDVDLGLRHDVTVAWLRLARAQALASLADEAARRAADLESVAQKRFEAGAAPREEMVQAGATAARARAEAGSAHATVSATSAQLAALLGWDPVRELRSAPGLPDAPPALPSLEVLRRRLPGHHPALAEARARVGAADARLTRASRERWPRLSAGASVDLFDPTLPGTDVAGIFSMELPLFGKRLAARRTAEAERSTAAADLDQTRASALGALVVAYRRCEAAASRAQAFATGVVPAEREADRMAHTAYAQGQTGLVAVLQADRALLDVEGELIDARAEAAVAHADLVQAAGGPW